MPSVKLITVSLTRPSNTTDYAAGDVVTDGSQSRFVFEELSEFKGKGGIIQNAVLISSANQATKIDADLFLFAADVTDLDADNAAFTPTDDQLKNCIGVIDFADASFKAGDGQSGASGNAICVAANVGIAFHGDTLYGVLVARNAYTPVSAEVFTVSLSAWR